MLPGLSQEVPGPPVSLSRLVLAPRTQGHDDVIQARSAQSTPGVLGASRAACGNAQGDPVVLGIEPRSTSGRYPNCWTVPGLKVSSL